MPDYIEGRRAVEEALKSGVPIKRVLISESMRDIMAETAKAKDAAKAAKAAKARGNRGKDGRGKDTAAPETPAAALARTVEAVKRKGLPIQQVSRADLDQLSAKGGSHGAHQGIMCEVERYQYTDLMQIARTGAAKDNSLIIACDHITDEGNLGAIIRTAEVIGADGVIIPNKRAAQVTVGVYKTSAGAALHLPIACVSNLSGALRALKEEAGFWVAGASEKASQDIWHAPLHGRLVLVAGSEGEGISHLVQQQCDFMVSLPQAGKVGSLNVAQATTAISYEWLRQCTELAARQARKGGK